MAGTLYSLDQLISAIRLDIAAAAQSAVPECTSSEYILNASSLVPLHQPRVGLYAKGGAHDIPSDFATHWATKDASGDAAAPIQATVEALLSYPDDAHRRIVQRAASRGLVAAIQAVDGFKYALSNAWGAKDKDGERFSYVCNDSVQNKERWANGNARYRHKPDAGERLVSRKPTFDCKGSIGTKFSASGRSVIVHYRHIAVHEKAALQVRRVRSAQPGYEGEGNQRTESGLLQQLRGEEAAYASPHITAVEQRAVPPVQSNTSRPLKRKYDAFSAPAAKQTMRTPSLADLLKQDQSHHTASSNLGAVAIQKPQTTVAYELPSWLPVAIPPSPPPVPRSMASRDQQIRKPANTRPDQPRSSNAQQHSLDPRLSLTWHNPSAGSLENQPDHRWQKKINSAMQSQPRGQGLFMTLKSRP